MIRNVLVPGRKIAVTRHRDDAGRALPPPKVFWFAVPVQDKPAVGIELVGNLIGRRRLTTSKLTSPLTNVRQHRQPSLGRKGADITVVRQFVVAAERVKRGNRKDLLAGEH